MRFAYKEKGGAEQEKDEKKRGLVETHEKEFHLRFRKTRTQGGRSTHSIERSVK